MHYRLYKAGKLWLNACVATLGIFAASTSVHADDQQTAMAQTVVATQNSNSMQTNSTVITDNDTNSKMPNSINGYTKQGNSGTTSWQNANGQLANGWQTNQNDWYYFNNGKNITNWQYIDNNWYYMNPQNSVMETGLHQINNATYYLNEQHDGTYGAMKTGWQNVNNIWYHFANNGVAQTGWYRSPAGFWYYFDSTGKAQTGWKLINSRWYLFDNTNANAYTGWFQSDYGNWYYFDPANAWADTGWHFLNGTWYYFDPTNAWLDLNETLNYNWQQVMGQYWNSSSIAIQLQRNGAVYSTTNNSGLRYETASTVKVAVLAMLLHNTGGNLNYTQQSLAMRMIRNSDNNATTEILTNYLGGITSLSAIYNALGMNQTTASSWWGTTLTVPTDQLKLLNMIYLDSFSNYLNERSKNYIKWLMGTISSGQRWGISAGSSSYYLKNGWRPASDNGLWEVNSIGYIPNGKNSYTIAVYTRNNRNFNWGVSYVEALARITKKIIG